MLGRSTVPAGQRLDGRPQELCLRGGRGRSTCALRKPGRFVPTGCPPLFGCHPQCFPQAVCTVSADAGRRFTEIRATSDVQVPAAGAGPPSSAQPVLACCLIRLVSSVTWL